MAATKIADIIVPELWAPYVINRTKELSALFQSGIVTEDPQITDEAQGGGSTANMPHFKDLTGVSEVLSDTVPLTVNKIPTGQDVAVKHFRGKAWGSNDMAAALAGADPMAAIGDLAADWWQRDMQTTLLSSLAGVFASASMADAVVNISILDGNNATDANKISAESTIDAFSVLGDAGGDLTAIAMHSKIYYTLLKQNLIQFEPISEQPSLFPSYLGKRLIVDDSLPRVQQTGTGASGYVYTTYLFGAGAIGYGEGNPKEPVEMDRDILLGEEYLVNRRHFIMHPMGVRWAGTPAGTSPTNTELAVGTNWTAVYDRKQIPLVALRTNG